MTRVATTHRVRAAAWRPPLGRHLVKRVCATAVAAGLVVLGAAWLGAGSDRASTTCSNAHAKGSPQVSDTSDPLAEYPSWDRAAWRHHYEGLAVKKAKQLLARAPESVETFEALLRAPGCTDAALRVIRTIFEKHPESMARTIALTIYRSRFDRDEEYRPILRDLIAVGRRQATKLAKADAADAAYQLMRMQSWVNLDSQAVPVTSLNAFIRKYAGTDAALQAELDLLTRSTQDISTRIDTLARFSAAHRGTCAAAEAMRREAMDIGTHVGAGEDPTERNLRLLQINRLLESKEYAVCPTMFLSVELGACGLIACASKPAYAPGNVDRLITVYREYLKTHFGPDPGDLENGVGFLVNSKIRGLFQAKGEGIDGLDRFLAGLEREVPEPDAARYLRALLHDPRATENGAGTEPGPDQQTVALLNDLHKTGTALYQRKALATLAWLYGFYGDTRQARQYYAEYAREYPDSGYAWLAAIRAAECAADLGDWKSAASEYQSASTAFAAMPIARVVGHGYRARALEAINDFVQAKTEYQAALAAWDDDYSTYSSGTERRVNSKSQEARAEFAYAPSVTQIELEKRVAQLTRTLAAPGGAVLEQGRRLFDHGQRKEAAALLGDFATRFPASANGPEARHLAHKARLYDALDMLNAEGDTDPAAGLAALDALSREPYDSLVTAAKVTRACVTWKQGKQEEAARIMNEALAERFAHQPAQEPANDVEKDVAAIRSLLFRRWNLFSRSATPPPFVAVPRDVAVLLAGHRFAEEVRLYQRFPGVASVLLLDPDEIGFLSDMVNTVDGTKKRAPRTMTERPNQPVASSVDLTRFLNTFFRRPQGQSDSNLLAHPVIDSIEFMDDGRTRGRASVTIGVSTTIGTTVTMSRWGCEILLEKNGGTWKATGRTDVWFMDGGTIR